MQACPISLFGSFVTKAVFIPRFDKAKETLASPPPNLASKESVWINLKFEGGDKRSIISPKVITEAIINPLIIISI